MLSAHGDGVPLPMLFRKSIRLCWLISISPRYGWSMSRMITKIVVISSTSNTVPNTERPLPRPDAIAQDAHRQRRYREQQVERASGQMIEPCRVSLSLCSDHIVE